MTYAPPPPPFPPRPAVNSADVPLHLPAYGASLPVAFRRFWRNYATFSGRASRSEVWWWALCNVIAVAVAIAFLVLGVVTGTPTGSGGVTPGALFWGYPVVLVFWFLGTIVGNLALIWRRLHDANLAGPFYFLTCIPSVGGIALLVFCLLPANPAGARFDRYPGSGYPGTPVPPAPYPQGQYPPAPYPQTQYPPAPYPQTQHPQTQHPQTQYAPPPYPQPTYPQPPQAPNPESSNDSDHDAGNSSGA